MIHSYFVSYEVRSGYCRNTYNTIVDLPYRLTEQTWEMFSQAVKSRLPIKQDGVFTNVNYLGASNR